MLNAHKKTNNNASYEEYIIWFHFCSHNKYRVLLKVKDLHYYSIEIILPRNP